MYVNVVPYFFRTEMHIEGASEEERMAQAALAKSERMQQVLSALAVLASSSGVASERQQFMELVKDEIGTSSRQQWMPGCCIDCCSSLSCFVAVVLLCLYLCGLRS